MNTTTSPVPINPPTSIGPAINPPPQPQRKRDSSQRVVLHGITWKNYLRISRALDDHPGVHVTYDRGDLEIMTTSHQHEARASLLDHLLTIAVEEMGRTWVSGGSTTLRRKPKQRALEPDKCYWIANEPVVRGKDNIDLKSDPPPDFTIEVEVSRSALDRLSIYAAIGVPEVWRLGKQSLTYHLLQPDGVYAPSAVSVNFPQIAPDELLGFLALRGTIDEMTLLRQFRAWIRGQLTPPANP